MQGAASEDVFSRSKRLLLKNPSIILPNAVFIAVVIALQYALHPSFQSMLQASPSPSNIIEQGIPLNEALITFISATCYVAASIYMRGMSLAAWQRGTATFGDGYRAVHESCDRLALWVLITTVYALIIEKIFFFSFSKIFLSPDSPSLNMLSPLSNIHDFESPVLEFSLFTLIIFIIIIAVYFFSSYVETSIVIGERTVLASVIESVHVSSQKIGTTFAFIGIMTYAYAITLLMMVPVYLIFHQEIMSRIFAYLIMIFISPYFALASCGEYLSACNLPQARNVFINEKKLSLAFFFIMTSTIFNVFFIRGQMYHALNGAAHAYNPISSMIIPSANPLLGKIPSSSPMPIIQNTQTSPDPRLRSFITYARNVDAIRSTQKESIDAAYRMVAHGSQAYSFLEHWYSKHNPYKRGLRERVSSVVYAVTPLDASSYRVSWYEYISRINGTSTQEKWIAAIRGKGSSAEFLITSIVWERENPPTTTHLNHQGASAQNYLQLYQQTPSHTYSPEQINAAKKILQQYQKSPSQGYTNQQTEAVQKALQSLPK